MVIGWFFFPILAGDHAQLGQSVMDNGQFVTLIFCFRFFFHESLAQLEICLKPVSDVSCLVGLLFSGVMMMPGLSNLVQFCFDLKDCQAGKKATQVQNYLLQILRILRTTLWPVFSGWLPLRSCVSSSSLLKFGLSGSSTWQKWCCDIEVIRWWYVELHLIAVQLHVISV